MASHPYPESIIRGTGAASAPDPESTILQVLTRCFLEPFHRFKYTAEFDKHNPRGITDSNALPSLTSKIRVGFLALSRIYN